MIRMTLGFIFMLTVVADPLEAAGMRGLGDGWLLEGPDEASVLDGSPRLVVDGSAWWFGGGAARLFGMEDLPVASLGMGLAAGPWSVGVVWEKTGHSLFVEDRLDVALRFGRNPRVGLRVGLAFWTVRGFDPQRDWDPALEVTLGSGSPWSLRLTWQATVSAPWYGRTGRRELLRTTWVGGGVGLALALDRDADGSPAVGLHAMWRLDKRMGLGIRADPVTGSLGPCLTAAARGLVIRTSHLAHPALGLTHRFTLSVGNGRAAPR